MNTKNIKLLAAIFVGLTILVALPWIKQKIAPQSESSHKFENISVDFSQFSQENTEKISIKQQDKELVLVLQDGVWMVNKKEASQAKLDTLFQELQVAQVQKQSSKNKDNHTKFKVDQAQATVLELTSAGETSSFFIGKNGPSLDSFYARKKGVANVYLLKGMLKNNLSTEETAWEKTEENENAATESTPATLELPQ